MTLPSDYLADVSKTDLMRVITALATEVYELRDRQNGLEGLLRRAGVALDELDQAVEPAAYDAQRVAERDAFVARVFGALAAPRS